MSASEKLRALSTYGQHLGMLPRYAVGAKMGEVNPPDNIVSWERYRDALPQIVAVVEAAEQAARYDYCDEDDGEGLCSSSDGEFAEWQDIGDALAALDDALVSAES